MKPSHRYCPHCAALLADRNVDGRARLACSPECGYVFWNNPVPVVAGLVTLGDDVVLARNATWPTGVFSMITGFLEAAEAPLPALARETEEELGLVTRRATLIGHYNFPQANQLIIAFHVEAEGIVRVGPEIAEVKLIERRLLDRHDFGPLTLTARVAQDWLASTAG